MGFGGRGILSVANEAQPVYQNVAGTAPTPQVTNVSINTDENNTDSIMFGPFRDISATPGARMGRCMILPGQNFQLSNVNLADWYAISATANQRFRWTVEA